MKATDAASVFDGFARRRCYGDEGNFLPQADFCHRRGCFPPHGRHNFAREERVSSGSRNTAGLGRCAPQQLLSGSNNQSADYQTREKLAKHRLRCARGRLKDPTTGRLGESNHAYTPSRHRIRACRTRHPASRDRNGARRDHAENLASIPGRHHRQGRFPRPALPHVRRRSRQALGRRSCRRDLSELLADQDQRAVLRDAQGRARHQPLSDALCRRRIAGDQYRPDAGPGRHLRPGPALEEGAGRQGADRFPRRQGHHPADLGLAGRRRRQPLQARSSRPKMPRA